MTKTRVLIVDDSRTMRLLIAESISKDPEIEIVGEAEDPFEARDAIKRLDPDVVTLDIEMPKMNGLEFLDRIMRLRPTRVLVVSTLTERGAATTIRALELGAMDCVGKPCAKSPRSFDGLSKKIKMIATASLPSPKARVEAPCAPVRSNFNSDGRIVAVGASMGGVEAIATFLSGYPENCPPTVIVQHMPADFTRSFAARLNKLCRPAVREADDGAPIRAGEVVIAPGGNRHLQISKGSDFNCRLTEGDLVSGHRPSVDVLFDSVATVAGSRSIGVILTGMGRDGAVGLNKMKASGAITVGQDQATSVVYGMPRAAFEMGAVAKQLPLSKISEYVLDVTNTTRMR